MALIFDQIFLRTWKFDYNFPQNLKLGEFEGAFKPKDWQFITEIIEIIWMNSFVNYKCVFEIGIYLKLS